MINFLNNLEKEFIDFSTDVVPHFINKINTFKNENYHIDIGTIENLKIARNIFKKKLYCEQSKVIIFIYFK